MLGPEIQQVRSTLDVDHRSTVLLGQPAGWIDIGCARSTPMNYYRARAKACNAASHRHLAFSYPLFSLPLSYLLLSFPLFTTKIENISEGN